MNLRRLNRQPERRPAREQRLQCANAFDTRELVAETEMNARPEREMPVRPPLEIEALGTLVSVRIQIGGDDHRHNPIAFLQFHAIEIDILAHIARF